MRPTIPVTIRRSLRSLLPEILLALVASLACWLVIDRHFGSPIQFTLSAFGPIEVPLWPLVLILFGVRPLMYVFDCRHCISEHHVRSEWGRLSLNRDELEIAFENLKGVRMHQNFFERFLDVGSIVGWTGFPERPDLVMRGIKHPRAVLHLIGARVDQAKLKEARSQGHFPSERASI